MSVIPKQVTRFTADRSGSVQNLAWGAAMVAVIGVTTASWLDTATRQAAPTAALAMRATPASSAGMRPPTGPSAMATNTPAQQDISRRVAMLPKPQEASQRRWFWQRDPNPVASIREPVKNVLVNPALGMPQH